MLECSEVVQKYTFSNNTPAAWKGKMQTGRQFKANKKAVASNLRLIYTQTNQNITHMNLFLHF